MLNPTPPCDVCGNPVEMELGVRFSSGIASTAVVFEHPRQVACPTCGTVLFLTIIGISQFQMKTAQVPRQSQSMIIPAKVLLQ
jgi:hypothetical protein